MQISSTVLCRLPIHKASRNWFVTHLLYLNYLVNAVNYSSLKSSSGKCDYRQTDRHQTDKHFDFLGPSVLRTGGPKIESRGDVTTQYLGLRMTVILAP